MSRRPPEDYLKDEMLDRLARMNLELFSELWITRDRLATLEAILERQGVISSGDIDNFAPDSETNEKREALRDIMIENVLGSSEKHSRSVESIKETGKKLKHIHGQ